jgi:hypothetical protein
MRGIGQSPAAAANNNVSMSFNITQNSQGNTEENAKRIEGDFNGNNGFVRKIRKSVIQIISEESRPGGALYNVR